MQIKKLCKQINDNAKEKGFWDQERNVGELLMLVVSEISEALEAHRSGNTYNGKAETGICSSMIDFCMNKKNYNAANWNQIYELELKNCFETEIADAIIRLLDLYTGLDIDIEKFIEMKMHYNKSREKMHGKKY